MAQATPAFDESGAAVVDDVQARVMQVVLA